jgi:hypothetical protein
MKLIASLLLLMCTVVSSEAQLFASAKANTVTAIQESPLLVKQVQPVPYKVSMPPGLKMRNVGRTLTIIGGAMLIGGIIVFDNADPYYDYSSQGTTYYTKEEKQAALGVLMVMGGTGMTIPGIILWSKGGKKYKRHLEREAAFNFQGNGVSLSYRF